MSRRRSDLEEGSGKGPCEVGNCDRTARRGVGVRLRDMHLIEIEAFFTVRISVGCTVYVQMHLD
jgi:hypothetical protein